MNYLYFEYHCTLTYTCFTHMDTEVYQTGGLSGMTCILIRAIVDVAEYFIEMQVVTE